MRIVKTLPQSLVSSLFLLSLVFGAPRVVSAGEPRCVNTFIASPVNGSSVSGVVTVAGRAELEGAFVRYQVDFSTAGLNLWVLIDSAPQAVVDGPFGRWDTTSLPEGAYDLRVRTIDTSGNYCEQITTPIYVRKSGINSPAIVPLPIASTIEIPTFAGTALVQLPRIPSIPYCTPAGSMGSFIARSVRLCPGQTYAPFSVVASNVAVVGDPNRSAMIRSYGRAYGIRVRASNVLISGVQVLGSTAAGDMGNWLCLYEQCGFAIPPINGGAGYGGGILLEGNNNTVLNSSVQGGVVGIGTINGSAIKIINNQLSLISGWGIYGVSATNSYFVGNALNDINRSCTDPGGNFYGGGCESAGLVLMGAEANLIANNSCARSGNCYYLNGEGGRTNRSNRLYGNQCDAPSFNCFEITDAVGIEFDGNSAMLAPDNGAGCPLWLVRAQVTAGLNNHVAPCNHRGSKLDSTYEIIK